jgi:hypothetical protein
MDRQGEEGTELGGLHRGEEGKRREEDGLAPKQNSWIRHCLYPSDRSLLVRLEKKQ